MFPQTARAQHIQVVTLLLDPYAEVQRLEGTILADDLLELGKLIRGFKL